jgi:hypothetical protein
VSTGHVIAWGRKLDPKWARQRRHFDKRAAEGRCLRCGKFVREERVHCAACRKLQAAYDRTRRKRKRGRASA